MPDLISTPIIRMASDKDKTKSKSKSKTSGWDVVLYIVGAVVAVIVLYMVFEKMTGGSTNASGRRNMGKSAMSGIAALMAVIIIYYFSKNIYDGYEDTMAGEPWLVETTKNARSMSVIPGHMIPKSSDGRFGLEFSYSMWLYINEWNSKGSKFVGGSHHILHKGSMTGVPLQCPGLWLDKNTNVLILKMNTFFKNKSPHCKKMKPTDNDADDSCWLEHCKIPNIPVHKWVHITISVINRNVDIYINGFLKKRCLLKGLPWQNDGDLYLNAFNGFDGYMSRVRYFNYALPMWKIEQVVGQGPSQASCVDTNEKPPYLARNWWQETRYSSSGPFG